MVGEVLVECGANVGFKIWGVGRVMNGLWVGNVAGLERMFWSCSLGLLVMAMRGGFGWCGAKGLEGPNNCRAREAPVA